MKTLRIHLRKDPVFLDPRKGNDMVASQIHFMLYEGLLRLNPDMTLSPAQAESYEVSDDEKTYTFHLKDTLWSDKSPVTAYHFEKAWKGLLDPEFFSPDAYLLYGIKNAKKAKEGKLPLDQVGIRSSDAKTLVIELQEKSPHFLQIVASSVLLPIRIEKDPHHFSNGPFLLDSWSFNHKLVLDKNPHYHRASEINLDQIFIEIIDREPPGYDVPSNFSFDLIGTPFSAVPRKLLNDPEKQERLAYYPVANTKFVAFNIKCFPFFNHNIRKAFSYAINRKLIVDHTMGIFGKEALNIIPPPLLPENENCFSDGNDAKARELLLKGIRELRVNDIGPIPFIYVSSAINHGLAQKLQEMWLRTLGIFADLQPVSMKTLHERAGDEDFSVGLFSWLADYPDPMNILERFTDKDNHRNYSNWENSDYNRLIEEARNAKESPHYWEKIKQAENLLNEEAPFTCLYHENYTFMVDPRVKGFTISPLGRIYLDQLTVEPRK